MKTKAPFDGEIHAVNAKTTPDLNGPKREPGWFLGETFASTPAEALPSQSGAEAEVVAEEIATKIVLLSVNWLRDGASEEDHEDYVRANWTKEIAEAKRLILRALAKPVSEPAGGGVREAVARRLYKTYMLATNRGSERIDLSSVDWDEWFDTNASMPLSGPPFVELWTAMADAALPSPASSSPAEAEALPAGVERKPYDMIVKRLLNPPFGTETSERLLMGAAADAIRTLLDRVRALSPAPAQAGSAKENGQ